MGTINYILIIVLGINSVYAQEYDTIIWQADNKLSWEDFKGEAPSRNRAAAITASGVTYRFSTIPTNKSGDVKIKFVVSTYFYPQKSWYQPTLCDSFILSHEQLHFDISELYAQKLRKRLQDAKFTKNVKNEVKVIYNRTMKELGDFQDKYDSETNFSRDREVQILWQDKIVRALQQNKKP